MTNRNQQVLFVAIPLVALHSDADRNYFNSKHKFDLTKAPFYVEAIQSDITEVDEDGDNWVEQEDIEDVVQPRALAKAKELADLNWGPNWDGFELVQVTEVPFNDDHTWKFFK